MANHLYYGDNLEVLREHIRDESVDLIYLAGKTPKIPLMERGFKAAAREERDDQSELEL